MKVTGKQELGKGRRVHGHSIPNFRKIRDWTDRRIHYADNRHQGKHNCGTCCTYRDLEMFLLLCKQSPKMVQW